MGDLVDLGTLGIFHKVTTRTTKTNRLLTNKLLKFP